MSYFVTVSFDLNYADTNVYPKIHGDLKDLDFSKLTIGTDYHAGNFACFKRVNKGNNRLPS